VGGCSNCAGKTGCDHRKGVMLGEIERAMERLYPSRRWGDPDDAARFGAGVPEEEGQALAEELAAALDASTFFRRGAPEEYCDFVYVLCVGREPSLVQIRDGGVPLPDEIRDGERVDELYLRVCLSSMARIAGVQEVAMELVRAGAEVAIREAPRAGVYSPPLLRRFRRLVTLVQSRDILHVDFGEISAPPDGYDPGDYAALYGGAPHRANYLFYPQPTTTEVTTLLPVRAPAL